MNSPTSLADYWKRRRRVLIERRYGGLGDILMHRMLFGAASNLGLEIHFACPERYWPAVEDHPNLAGLHGVGAYDPADFAARWDTSTVCGETEDGYAPFSGPNRADVWADQCGLPMSEHRMKLRLTPEERAFGEERLRSDRPAAVVAPESAISSKSLTPQQLAGVVAGLDERGFRPYVLHDREAPGSDGAERLHGLTIREWMSVVLTAGLVVSVDSAAYHLAGGGGRPVVGVFSWADGLVYGKYYRSVVVQRHRSRDPGWVCGPCYRWRDCPKDPGPKKPCLTSLTSSDILSGVDGVLQRTNTGEGQWPSDGSAESRCVHGTGSWASTSPST